MDPDTQGLLFSLTDNRSPNMLLHAAIYKIATITIHTRDTCDSQHTTNAHKKREAGTASHRINSRLKPRPLIVVYGLFAFHSLRPSARAPRRNAGVAGVLYLYLYQINHPRHRWCLPITRNRELSARVGCLQRCARHAWLDAADRQSCNPPTRCTTANMTEGQTGDNLMTNVQTNCEGFVWSKKLRAKKNNLSDEFIAKTAVIRWK